MDPGVCRGDGLWGPSERGELDADAGAVGIDVGLAARHAQRGDAAPRRHQIVNLAHHRLLEVEAAAGDESADLGAQEIIVPGAAGLVAGGEAALVDPDLDRHQQPLRVADLEVVEADVEVEPVILEHDLARPRLQAVRHQPVEFGDVLHQLGSLSINWTSRGRDRKRWPPSRRMFWPVKLGVAMMNRKAATISATSTPRPRALRSWTASKLSRLCGPDTRVTDGAMPQTRTAGANARAQTSVRPARPSFETV